MRGSPPAGAAGQLAVPSDTPLSAAASALSEDDLAFLALLTDDNNPAPLDFDKPANGGQMGGQPLCVDDPADLDQLMCDGQAEPSSILAASIVPAIGSAQAASPSPSPSLGSSAAPTLTPAAGTRRSKRSRAVAAMPRGLFTSCSPAPSIGTACAQEACGCSSSGGGVLPASWLGLGSSSAACDGTANGGRLEPKLEWTELQALAIWPQPACHEVLREASSAFAPPTQPATPAEPAAAEPATPAASGAATAVAPTPQRRAAARTAVAAGPASGRRRRGGGVSQKARFGFSEKHCRITGWDGPTVAVYQPARGRTVHVAPLCPCGCGMPPYSDADWASGYLTTGGRPNIDDPNDPRNQPGRRLDKAGLVQHKPMSLRLLAFYRYSPSSGTRAGQKRAVPNERHTEQKVLAGKSKRRRTA